MIRFFGSEQSGYRPVLVVSREAINEMLPVVNVVPLTSRKSGERVIYPNEDLLPPGTGGLRKESIALWYQIRTIDTVRLEREIGTVADISVRNEVQESIRFSLER